jgi:hypothetical protein
MIASSSRSSLSFVLRRFTLAAVLCPLLFAASAQAERNIALVDTTPLSEADYARVNDSARGLGGLATGASWQNSPEWLEYEQWLDGRWSYIQRVRLNAMRAWASSELGSLRDSSQTVFYPFSGPDFLYVNTFFPDSRVLIMAGLEPIGTMPDLAALRANGRLGAYLQSVKTSLFTILAASFFKTKDMQTDFNNQQVDGLVPAIAVFLAREGYSIDSLQYVTLGHDGTLHPHAGVSGANGVQITYFRGDRSDARVLLYFNVDLDNDGMHSNPGFVRLMERVGPGITYLKAASYLLYEDYFSTIRNAILDNSVGVVEDDSGIPLHDFKPSLWDVRAYGNYTGPINLFKEHYQPDLAQFYAINAHSSLSFGSGYKYIAANSSLLVARKK